MKEKRLKPMYTNLDTAKVLVSVFGYKIMDDIIIDKSEVKKDGRQISSSKK